MPSQARFFRTSGVRSFLSASVGVFKIERGCWTCRRGSIGARGVEKSTAGTPGAIDDFFRERQEIVAVVVFLSRTISTRPAHPWRMPMTSKPSRSARKSNARIAGFRPGTSPPPVRIRLTLSWY